MIIVVEGPSAAGKTTWIGTHCAADQVLPEMPARPAPDRAVDPHGSAAHWAEVSVTRWQAACDLEAAAGTAICDTDPFKLHYVWSLWQAGHASRRQWHAGLAAHRALFARGRLGIADLILIGIPDPATLAARRQADGTRTRRHFALHAQLADPLHAWYCAVRELDSRRVRWELPATGLPDTTNLGPRPIRTGSGALEALLDNLPAR